MRHRLAAATTSAVALVTLPAAAHAAAVGVLPQKPCYRSGERMLFGGTGYTPNAAVRITSDGARIGSIPTDPNGAFAGRLTVRQPRGQRLKTYAAIDGADPALFASLPLRVSALSVRVPRTGRAGRRLRVRARGFTSGKTLYAHVLRGRRRRNIRIGRLRGACGTVAARRRLFRRGARSGRYTIQFDTSRRYSRRTRVRVRYRVRVFPRARSAAAASSWSAVP